MFARVRARLARAALVFAAALVLPLLVPTAAQAACSPSFSGTTLTISCSGLRGNTATVSHDASGNILVNGSSVSGSPTLTNTDLIDIDGSNSIGDLVTIDESNGLFAPGATTEPPNTGPSEIEFDVGLGDGNDSLTVRGVNAATDSLVLSGDAIHVNFSVLDLDFDILLSDVENVTLDGQGGPDSVNANTDSLSAVTLIGGDGNDELRGGPASDVLLGGRGNDRLSGSPSADDLDGGVGTDELDYAGSPAAVSVVLLPPSAAGGDAEGDSIAGIENLRGSPHDDTLFGDSGPNVIEGGAGGDFMGGGGGTDTLSYLVSTGVTVNLVTDEASGGNATGDVIDGTFENVVGSSSSDTITGDAGPNVIEGSGGADTLVGNGGADTLDYFHSTSGVVVDLGTATASGGDAAGDSFSGFENLSGSTQQDVLTGSAGPNVIAGGLTGDTLNGGGGQDTLDYTRSFERVLVNLKTGTASGGDAEGDTFTSFENLTGSALKDNLTGSDGANVLRGLGGNDTLDGLLGTDTLNGGPGTDTCLNGETLQSCEA